MRPTPTRLSAAVLGLALLLAPGPTDAAGRAGPPAARKLAVVPFYSPELMWRLYSPLIAYLARQTGEAWTLVLPPNHQSFDNAVCSGKVDVALMGPVPLARLHRRCRAAPFLVALGQDGRPDYHSVIVTASPDVTSVLALRGRRVAFFKGSTAAHVIPVKMLADAGLPPGSYEPIFVESQDRVMSAVLTGGVAAGGVKSALRRRFSAEPNLRTLQTSTPLPNFAFAALPALPAAVRERVSAALLRLHPRDAPPDAEIVKGWDDELKGGFVVASPVFLDAARALLNATEGAPRAP